MRRLDTLELERAMEEITHLVNEGELTVEQAFPVFRAFFRRGMSDEAAELFDESCLSRARSITITVIEADEDDDVPFGREPEEPAGDEEFWLRDEE